MDVPRCTAPTAGTREGVRFLKEQGLALPLAQRVAKLHGQHTVERVKRDPYAALACLNLSFRCLQGRGAPAWGM